VTNGGDGSGTWTSPDGLLVINGDGTGTLNSAEVKVPAMPDFALLGQLPKLQTLRPLGKSCGTLIRIDANVLFDFDKAELRPSAGPVLTAIAKTLTATSGRVDVDGYTDAKGSDAYNLDLSNRRAAAVVAALTSDGAVTPLQPHGYGEARPIARNTINGKDNPAGRQLNRRVELVIHSS
jgi:OOP family OmpA-OmpF porin